MRKQILVLGAGSGASNNLIRSLRVGDRDLVIIGGQADRFVLKKSLADRTYLIAAREASDFAASVRRVVDAEAIDLVVPNSDADVRAVSAHRFRLGTRVFLPSADVIELCQDKYALTTLLHSHGVPTPETHPIPDAYWEQMVASPPACSRYPSTYPAATSMSRVCGRTANRPS